MLLAEELESYVQSAPARGCKHKVKDRYIVDGESLCRECAIDAAACCRCQRTPVTSAVVLSTWRFGTRAVQDHVVRPLCAEHADEAGEPRRFPSELRILQRERDGELLFAVSEVSVTPWPPRMRYDPPPEK